MDLYEQKAKSLPQKTVIHILELVLICISYWTLFSSGGPWLEQHLHIHNSTVGIDRRIIIFTFNCIIFFRIAYSTFFLVKRKIGWGESISIALAFGLYYIGFSLFVLPKSNPIDGLDYFALLLFIVGCILNTGSEIMRNRWKKKPENQGKIYTLGFFKYSRHINYFGDLLWVIAYTVITRNWFAISIPLFLFFFFAFYNAPLLDKYLQKKYGKGYEDYAKKTKMLIPFIY